MPRPRCLTCDNVGQVVEYRLVWSKREAEGEPPLKCSRRVESLEEGMDRIRELAEDEFDPEILSGARACPNCQKGREERKEQVAKAEQGRPEKELEDKPVVRDWKMAQAGDKY